ncbi:Hpt domain-containing protein [Arthrobacter sp. NPDC056727]|uniref:Hpt domain-containing protein n=1 Tax=Arthrobacter sp. NPDC056727 TaxID=3345927 RepID=UPI00366B2EEF
MRRRTRLAEPPPVLAPEYLLELAEGSTNAAAESFAASYAALLPGRVDRIIQSVGTGNRHKATEAALSLKAASSMAGALRMSHLCGQMEQALVMADMAEAVIVVHNIKLHLPDLQEALAARPPIT